ncbi:Crp/Fnr family transcriptional regulator [Candidatus Margulisiibacteriota bacterium]
MDTGELLQKIEHLGLPKQYKQGEYVFMEGDAAAGFFYIKSGDVSIFKMDEQGREIEIRRATCGEFLGEVILFTSETFPVFARAGAGSSLLYFPKERVLEEINTNPKIAQYFLALMAGKCLALNKRIETLSLKSVRQRLLQYLFSQCRGDGRCVIELTMKKGDLAKHLGTVNETLSRNLKKLQEEDLIKVTGSKIHIKNCPALKKELALI